MKTFQQVMDKFEKELTDLGVSAYVIAARNPDGEDMYWHRGSDILWQLGVLKMLEGRHNDICGGVHLGEEEEGDDYDRGF